MTEPNDWVYGIWFLPGEKSDWLATLVLREGKIHLDYRFRYYKDDKAFDSDDQKNWYHAEFPGDDIEAAGKTVTETALSLARAGFGLKGEELAFVEMKCPAASKEFIDKISAQPWAHVKIIEKGHPDFEQLVEASNPE